MEKANILYQHHKPMLKHDKPIDFPKLDYKTKTERIKNILDIESQINLNQDDIFHPYAKEDLIELFKNIYQFLYETKIDQQLLNRIDSLVKKYCIIRNSAENDSRIRNDPFCDGGIMELGNIPLRAYAAPCQVLITKCNPTYTNRLLTLSLSNDCNSYVRERICQQLPNLYEVFPNETIKIAEKYCNDDKYIRFFLQYFLKFIAYKDRNNVLNLFKIILDKYGKIEFSQKTAYEEAALLNFVVAFITESFLLKQQKEYQELFNELLNSQDFSDYIKKKIICTIRQKKFISNPIILDKTIEICLKLLREGSNKVKVKEHVEFFFFYNLIQINTSLYPKTKKLLDEICKRKYPQPILHFHNDFHFTILYYLERFCIEFPDEAAKYLITILNHNEFLYNSVRITTIINILEKLLNNNINSTNRNCLMIILKKIAMRDRRALNVMEKLDIEP